MNKQNTLFSSFFQEQYVYLYDALVEGLKDVKVTDAMVSKQTTRVSVKKPSQPKGLLPLPATDDQETAKDTPDVDSKQNVVNGSVITDDPNLPVSEGAEVKERSSNSTVINDPKGEPNSESLTVPGEPSNTPGSTDSENVPITEASLGVEGSAPAAGPTSTNGQPVTVATDDPPVTSTTSDLSTSLN